jgi:protease I
MEGEKRRRLDGMKIAILATDGYEESELTRPRQALEEAGALTHVIAPHGDSIQGFRHFEKAGQVVVDATLDRARPDDYDAVLLPGGVLNADALRAEPEARQFVQRIHASDKPIAVICHGAWLLLSAGLLKGRTITSYHTIQDDIRNAGARWEDRDVVRDGNVLSSRKPDDIPAFDREMIQLFGEHLKRREGKSSESRRV